MASQEENDKKSVVVCYLQELAAANNKEPFKKKAYLKAIASIQAIEGPLTEASQLKGVSGVGKSIFEKVRGVLEEGVFVEISEKAVENCKDRGVPDSEAAHKAACIQELVRVPSIGQVTAEKLYKEHGIRSLKELQERPELLTDAQRVGLKYVDDIDLRIPRAEMIKHDQFLGEVIREVDPEAEYVIAGSYRRGLASSGDIDLLIKTSKENALADLVAALKKKKYILDDLAQGNSKYMGMSRIKYGRHARRLDMLVMDSKRFPFAVLYFTGSQHFNIMMRKEALKQGYSLSEYGLKKTSDNTFVDTDFTIEEDVFKFLNMPFVEPTKRDMKY